MLSDLFDREVTCPACKNVFTSKRVKTSAVKTVKRDPDFHAYYSGENPNNYAIFVCNDCGFSAFEKDFEELSLKSQELVKDKITRNWKRRSFGDIRTPEEALETYKLALLCYSVIGASSLVLGKITMRIAFLYRELGDPKEKDFIRFTIMNYTKAFTQESRFSDIEEELMVMFLVGEFHRQLGEANEAVQWFTKALEVPELKKKRHLELRVREQWGLLAEERRQNKQGGTQ